MPIEQVETKAGADESFEARDERGRSAACSLWWSRAPSLGSERVGCIGAFRADEGAPADALLAHACKRLREQGCTLAVGPLDGSTWHSYRFVTERGSEPPFFLEPDNPDAWPALFTAAGFAPLAHYTSALDRDLSVRDERAAPIEGRLLAAGVSIRNVDLGHFEEELGRIFRVSLASFERNVLYTPIDEAEFVGMYLPLRPYVDESLVMLAEHDGEVAGFIFALPDWLARRRGESEDTMIVKTLARRPDDRFGGLGALLLERCRSSAHERGFRRCIHALMYDENVSVQLSHRFGDVMRGYTLFSRSLVDQ